MAGIASAADTKPTSKRDGSPGFFDNDMCTPLRIKI
jgi:hypothetical protein